MFTADTLLNAVNQAVLATDGGGTIVYANPAAVRLYDGDGATILGRKLADVMPDQDVTQLFAAVREQGNWSGGRRGPDGNNLSFITARALGTNGTLDGFVIASTTLDGLDLPRVVDESERLRLENRLLQAERISARVQQRAHGHPAVHRSAQQTRQL